MGKYVLFFPLAIIVPTPPYSSKFRMCGVSTDFKNCSPPRMTDSNSLAATPD